MTGRAEAPLAGIGVVVTRPEDEDAPLASALRAYGARVVAWPVIRWAPPADPAPLAAALRDPDRFDWVAFTSPRAVDAVAERIDGWPPGVRVAVVGESTGLAAEGRGWRVDLVPTAQTAEALVAAFGRAGLGAGARVLLPASEIARPTLAEGLRALGAEVVEVTAYRTLPAALDADACRATLRADAVRVISFASPSAVENLRAALGPALFDELAGRVVLAAIGPTTAAAVRAAGGTQVIEATDHSLEGLASRIAEWGKDQQREGPDGLPDP